VQSGAARGYPFLFSGAQLETILIAHVADSLARLRYAPPSAGYYGNFNPTLVHSVSGGAVPYTGADAPGFGSMGGRVPHSMDRATRAASREEASGAVRNQGQYDLPGGGSSQDDFPDSGQNSSAPAVPPAVVNAILDIPTAGFGGLIIGGLVDLFGGGGDNSVVILRAKAFGPSGIDPDLAVSQAPPNPPRGLFAVALEGLVPDVTVGLDSPVGGVKTTFPFRSGGDPVTARTGLSLNSELPYGANAKIFVQVGPDASQVTVVGNIRSVVGVGASVNVLTGQAHWIFYGPQLNLPLGFGANGYITITY
jgi:hypothetical protein